MAIVNAQPLGVSGNWLADVLTKGLSQALEAMTGRKVQSKWTPSEGRAEDGRAGEWWEQPITAGAGARLWVCVPEASWKVAGALALAAAGIDDASPEDCSGTWREIQAQALSSAVQEIAGRIRKDVACEGGRVVTAVPDVSHAVDIVLSVPEELWFRCGWDAALQDVLEPEEGKKPAPPQEQPPASAVSAVRGNGNPTTSAVQNSRTLDLLLEVELPVSISFGRVQLPLKDVLKLNSGSIVELNRSISEPVEIIINNCVIARGEVVVVDGNYGVRVKQIISKEERLRTLY